MIVFKRNYTTPICQETNFHSGEFTFKAGYGYDGYWKNKHTVIVKYYNIQIVLRDKDIDKYLT